MSLMPDETVPRIKNPLRVRAGHIASAARWGPPGTRTVRISDLTLEQRRLVVALIDAVKSGAATEGTPVTAHAGGQANDRAAA